MSKKQQEMDHMFMSYQSGSGREEVVGNERNRLTYSDITHTVEDYS